LKILADTRQALRSLQDLMMDRETLLAHLEFSVEEPTSTVLSVANLLQEERQLFEGLSAIPGKLVVWSRNNNAGLRVGLGWMSGLRRFSSNCASSTSCPQQRPHKAGVTVAA
jgi:uncharacterized protein (DUF2126 family)